MKFTKYAEKFRKQKRVSSKFYPFPSTSHNQSSPNIYVNIKGVWRTSMVLLLRFNFTLSSSVFISKDHVFWWFQTVESNLFLVLQLILFMNFTLANHDIHVSNFIIVYHQFLGLIYGKLY